MAEQATADSPHILISFHYHEEKWRQRVITHLGLAAEKFGVLDDRRGVVPLAGTEPPLGVAKAKVLIILVSPKYMASTWIASDRGSALLAELSLGGLRIFYVIVEEVSLKKFPVLRANYVLQINSMPLAEAVVEKQNSVLADLAGEVTKVLEEKPFEETASLPSIADLSRFERSNEVESAINKARFLAMTTGLEPATVTTSCLLFGLAESGRDEIYFRTSQFVWGELTQQGLPDYQKLFTDHFPRAAYFEARPLDIKLDAPNPITPNVLKVFELAEEFSRRTVLLEGAHVESHPPIGARHLFAALIILTSTENPIGSEWILSKLVKDVPELRRRFYELILKNIPKDDHEAWRSILIDLSRSEERSPKPEPSSPVIDSVVQPTVAGFMADDWQGRDLLGIERDVNAFASLVAACNVEPPLSIGLFGDWGSGKSHFMRQMRKRVELLSKGARDSGKAQNELGYYKNIAQIEFNAWHYIEGNLWASLVNHIFANLRLSEDEPRDFAQQRRDELIQKLGVKEEIQDKINSKVQGCEDELRKLNERKERAEAELGEKSTQLEQVKAGLETLSVRVAFTDEEKDLLHRLDIGTGSEITGAEVQRKYRELRGGWGSVKAKWKLFWTDPRAKRRYGWSALLALIPVAGALLVNFTNFPGMPTFVASVLGFVATLYVAAKPALAQFKKSLKALEKQNQEVEQERRKRVTELESQIKAFGNELATAKLDSDTVGKEIAKLKADIESTDTNKILAEFIEDRAAATDYRRHLGLLALIRRDFEKLRDLFQAQRKEANDGSTDPKKINNRIDRIILYIDDLDRCPPDRVVQVLQAIHLLLAFPLFVVVVGVDSRWIERSLQQSYEWLRETEEDAPNNDNKGEAKGADNNRYAARGATPHDYLEKIFQIPFWLRSMTSEACLTFLNGLVNDATNKDVRMLDQGLEQPVMKQDRSELTVENVVTAAASVSSVADPVNQTVNEPAQSLLAEREQAKPSFVPPAGEKTPNILDLAPSSLQLSTYEVDYMKELVTLMVRSPRVVKRFLNCYRLIKVGLAPYEFAEFVGENGESNGYRAVMLLLAVITGTPTVSSYFLAELTPIGKTGPTNIATFADALANNAEMERQPEGKGVIAFLRTRDFGAETRSLYEEMVRFKRTVSRFSFSVYRPRGW
jgi:hypothetical protein